MDRVAEVSSLKMLEKEVVTCRLCPRLVQYRESVPSKSPVNWRKPVPGFGDPHGWLLILGLAPSSQGGNRTGRIFTGDKSGDFLIKSLYNQGFANQPISESKRDGLLLRGCYLTAVVKCVPPHHRPLRDEFINCSCYWQNEMKLLSNLASVLALGKSAFDTYIDYVRKQIELKKRPVFKHGAVYLMEGLPLLYASYHPSPQNTNTGKLSEKMFNTLLETIKYHYENEQLID